MPARDRLRAERLRPELRGRLIGSEILVVEEATSTNDVVFEMAGGDWPEGLVVFAEKQSGGRGQRGHSWESAAFQGLWFSVLLRPEIPVAESARLSEWAAEVTAATIERLCGLPARVRLPNDVYIGDRKVAGILVEMRARPAQSHVAILGIGINMNQAAEDFSIDLRERAVSLALLSKRRQDRHAFALELLQALDRTYRERFRQDGW